MSMMYFIQMFLFYWVCINSELFQKHKEQFYALMDGFKRQLSHVSDCKDSHTKHFMQSPLTTSTAQFLAS